MADSVRLAWRWCQTALLEGRCVGVGWCGCLLNLVVARPLTPPQGSGQQDLKQSLEPLLYIHHTGMSASSISALVRALGSDDDRRASIAAWALYDLADATACAAIVAAGGVPALVKCLRSCDEEVQEAAARVLNILACSGNSAAIAAAGAIPALVQCLRSSKSIVVHEAAALLLVGHTIYSPELSPVIASEGAIPLLVRCLRDGNELGQWAACGALHNLAVGSPDRCAAIAAEGAIPLLVQRLGSHCGGSLQRLAAHSLANLAHDNPTNSAAIVAAGGIPALQQLLHIGTMCAQCAGCADCAQCAQQHVSDLLHKLSSHEQAHANTSTEQESTSPATAAIAAAIAATVAEEAEPAVAPNEAGPSDVAATIACAGEGCHNTEHLRLCSG